MSEVLWQPLMTPSSALGTGRLAFTRRGVWIGGNHSDVQCVKRRAATKGDLSGTTGQKEAFP